MIKLLLFSICALILILVLKPFNPTITKIIAAFTAISVLIYASLQLGAVIDFIKKLADNASIDSRYIEIILKCIGICILGDFTTGICKDCGEGVLASGVEFVCKCSILVIALPLYSDIFNLILKLWK